MAQICTASQLTNPKPLDKSALAEACHSLLEDNKEKLGVVLQSPKSKQMSAKPTDSQLA